ncbi:MAG: Ig domain-containing protein, partial [Candidatus Bipolaricaulaceae bacterium]
MEFYTTKEYDKAIATVVWSTGTESEIFKRTSKDSSVFVWDHISVALPVPSGAQTMSLKFEFDSVDAYKNDFFGWAIDDVVVWKVPPPLAITTTALPPANYGASYTYTLAASGGQPPYSWALARDSRLPLRLALSSEGVISGIPEEIGTFTFTVVVTDALGNIAQRTLTLSVLPAAGVHFEDFDDISYWTLGGLWHTTSNVKNVDLTGRGKVAYYGKDEATTPNYNTGERTHGALLSPEWPVTDFRGQKVVISFDYWRQVEHYPAKPYDKTEVKMRFKKGATYTDWQTVWSNDSTVPSEARWVNVAVEAGNVPADATHIQVQFFFDSVDAYANNYVGWLVDNLMISFAAAPLRIVTLSLPEGEAGLPYFFKLEAQGGKPPYRWRLAPRNDLPPGLVLDSSTGEIRGVPRDVWRGDVCIEVTDDAGQSASKCFFLLINPRTTLFFEDFEDITGWSYAPQGLWHTTSNVKNVDLTTRGSVAYYGKDDATNPNYNTGGRTHGALVSPEIELSGIRYVLISFKHWRWVESYHAAFDQTYVQVRFRISGTTPTWTPWITPAGAYKDARDPSEKQWMDWVLGPFEVPIGADKMQLKFVFDSVDRFWNDYVGWLIDDVRVSIAQSGVPLSVLAVPYALPRDTKITVFNVPNPVRDVHTTTFVVRGVEADLIRVEVYDL